MQPATTDTIMPNEQLYLILWAVLSFWTLGQIWFGQIVIYPLFAMVGDREYIPYHRSYTRRIPLVVILPGFASFLFPMLLAWLVPTVPTWMHGLNVITGLIGLLLTIGLLIPRHNRLEKDGKNETTINELVGYNWFRTMSISGQAVVTCCMLAHVMRAGG
jgi:hypothetical protein